MRTKAVLDGDEWVITGQKVWTTFAHHADWCFVITRTNFDAPAHQGISYILVPMEQPGVTYRPLRQMTGAGEFNEVFFDEARTPADMVVGEVNGGWKVAMTTLGFERGTAFLVDAAGASSGNGARWPTSPARTAPPTTPSSASGWPGPTPA